MLKNGIDCFVRDLRLNNHLTEAYGVAKSQTQLSN